ncbi:MAG: AmmeMemoRadiSam system radical SAM enzyme [Candidatus Omnitrophica bacterium]|nr:AmmeMemoRadiSam system radical SAM enzyme [Candidatus Omnitrophota bacterium]
MPCLARYWKKTDDGRLQCHLCPRLCTLSEGQRGFCFVRQNINNMLVLTTYGRSSGFCLDPIEKKPLNHFLPGTSCLSFGTAGCNLGCKFCQNWDISKSKEFDRLTDEASPKHIAEAAVRLEAKSIAFTYNDPVIFAEYAIDTAIECRRLGIKTVAVTAGYITPEARGEFYQYIDAANVDLKGFSEDFYHKITSGHLQPVLDTLVYLKKKTGVWFEITNLMIPGANDSKQETADMCQWIADHLGPDVPLHFTAFHPDYKMMDTPRTPLETLLAAREIALSKGLHYVYTGNVHDAKGSSTWCPSCKNLLIERDWYMLGQYNLRDGNICRFCGYILPGIFEENPGQWGAKRVPVRL